MADLITLSAAALGGFFLVASVVLLARYRQVSRELAASTDLAKDLWESLEARLKKQDERLVDVMTRVDVLQSKFVGGGSPPSLPAPQAKKEVVRPAVSEVASPQKPVTQQPQITAPRPTEAPSAETPQPGRSKLDKTELAMLQLLAPGPKTSVEIKASLKLSREHVARLLKGFFERGLVVRDDSAKPFVYQLTDEGRKLLPAD
jgi:DNA-binding CsgD family transcriptional regulator